jgi:Zn-dependent M28 family amino/carboxypeptidase
MLVMPGKSWSGPLPPLTEEEARLRDSLRSHVELLAGEIGERTVFCPRKLEAAAEWIEGQLRGFGYPVEREEFEARGTSCRNLVAQIAGRGRASEIVLVGAHYDSVAGCPAANDNGTGVAGLIEIARALRAASPARTVRLVAFVNEEPPLFQTEEMGSLVHARASRARGDAIAAMISLETLGYYSDAAKSQSYPPPFNLFYPSTGNFIAFVGNWSSRGLVRDAIGSFRRHTRFPSEGGAPPGAIEGVGWSDHWSFWQAGYPAIMVTDTAPFRYPHYHEATDTPDKVDHDRLARVVAGLARVVMDLANAGT